MISVLQHLLETSPFKISQGTAAFWVFWACLSQVWCTINNTYHYIMLGQNKDWRHTSVTHQGWEKYWTSKLSASISKRVMNFKRDCLSYVKSNKKTNNFYYFSGIKSTSNEVMKVVSTGKIGYRNRAGCVGCVVEFPPEHAIDLKNKTVMVSLFPIAGPISLAQTVCAGMLTYLVHVPWSL